MKRRRFLMITAAVAATPLAASDWRGQALGADLSVTLAGPGAERALADLKPLVGRLDATFSLYRASELTDLNGAGHGRPSPWLSRALALCDELHRLTGGVFDPTVQPLWRALAEGGDTGAAAATIGWGRVALGSDVRLGPGQALTLNGMAQGLAADLVRDWLRLRGFGRALVNMGEYAALGGPFRLELEDPEAGPLGQVSISGRAMAVSSPGALSVGGRAHILHPKGQAPLWSTVAVQAESAALADGLSTALVFADAAEIAALRRRRADISRVIVVDQAGGLTTL